MFVKKKLVCRSTKEEEDDEDIVCNGRHPGHNRSSRERVNDFKACVRGRSAHDHLLWRAYQAALREAYFEPYAKQAGVKITEDEYNSEVAKIRAMVQSKTVSWDVVDTGAGAAMQMCAEGIMTIDWNKLGLDRAKFMDGDKNDCGVPNQISAMIIAYDKGTLPNGPKAIVDLFDMQKFPGKRGLYKDPWGNLEWALIADGVASKTSTRFSARARESIAPSRSST
ncbi:extracellular solute-binding protein [Bradyrhizobium icense]|uniref:extracellular solute-binding protein n=1 Tax=Bradyrhizobium icense TaxID=1274631 RepID=UPI000A6D8FFA